MPQTTVLPAWKAGFPIENPAQKPGGVVVSTTLIANAVPNKPQPGSPTIQSFDAETDEMVDEPATMSMAQSFAQPLASRAGVDKTPHTQEDIEEADMEEAEEDGINGEHKPTKSSKSKSKGKK